MNKTSDHISKKILIILPILSLSLILVSLLKTNFVSRENDTRLYNKFVKQLINRPLSQIIAPKWNHLSSFAETETPYVRDHLPGQYIIPVLLGKIGFPKSHVLYFVNQVIRLFILFLIYCISLFFLKKNQALLLPLFIQFIPMNFTYQLRANQEHPLLFFSLIGILGCLHLDKNRKKAFLFFAISIIGSFFIKGLAFIPITSTIFVFVVFNSKQILKDLYLYIGILIFFIFSCLLFEYYFRYVTDGISFFSKYFHEQIYNRSIKTSSMFDFYSRYKSFKYYFLRIIGYAAPFSLIYIYKLIKLDRKNLFHFNYKNIIDLVKNNPLIIVSIISLILFSLSNRLASRYIYPVYFIMGTYFIIEILKRSQLKYTNLTRSLYYIYIMFSFAAISNMIIHRGNYLIYPH